MFNKAFWKNWEARRNGVGVNLEFFANSFEHAERTLRHAPEQMGIPGAFDVSIVPAPNGGYVATIYAPFWLAHHLGIAVN